MNEVSNFYSFNLLNWSLWLPPIEKEELPGSTNPANAETARQSVPDCSFVPAGIRRKLSLPARIFFWTANRLSQNGHTPDRIVFTSHFGEIDKSIALLNEFYSTGYTSPLGFSLSVHNTSLGLFSIFSKFRGPSIAMGAGEHSLEYGLLEGITWLKVNPNKEVWIVNVQEPLPDLLSANMLSPPVAGCCFVLSNKQQVSPASCRINLLNQPTSKSPSVAHTFMNWLNSGKNALEFKFCNMNWIWEKT